MGHYKSNVRDLEFNLFEVFNVQGTLGTGPFEQADEDTARGVLSELNNLAIGPLAESFADADRNPPVFDPKTHSATLPESFKKSYKALWDGEWYRLSLPEELGGLGVPPSVSWAAPRRVRSRGVLIQAEWTVFWKTRSPFGATMGLMALPGSPARSGDFGFCETCWMKITGRPAARKASRRRAMFCSASGLLRGPQ